MCVKWTPLRMPVEINFLSEIKQLWFGWLFGTEWEASHYLIQWSLKVGHGETMVTSWLHDDVMKWMHFPRYWSFVRGIHRSPVNSPHKGQWRGALMFALICTRINGWVNNGEAGDLRRHRVHFDVIIMFALFSKIPFSCPIFFKFCA